jgi:hypothetical protein
MNGNWKDHPSLHSFTYINACLPEGRSINGSLYHTAHP